MPAVEPIPLALSKVYLDSSWANLGTTQVSGQVLSWSATFTTGASQIATADARSDLDFGAAVIDASRVGFSAQITLLLDGQYDTEKTKAEAQDLRALRIQTDGASSRQLKLDALVRHSAGSVFAAGRSNGQDIAVLRFEGTTDGTNFLEATVVNGVANLN